MKLTNSRTGGAGRGNGVGKLALLLMVAFSMEMCAGQSVTPAEVEREARVNCERECQKPNGCKDFIDFLQGRIDKLSGSTSEKDKFEVTLAQRVKKLLAECCNSATGELKKCSTDKIKEISSRSRGLFLAPKACLMLLSLGTTLMMAWLY